MPRITAQKMAVELNGSKSVVIFSADNHRTVQAANIIAEVLKYSDPVRKEGFLSEIGQGPFGELSMEKIAAPIADLSAKQIEALRVAFKKRFNEKQIEEKLDEKRIADLKKMGIDLESLQTQAQEREEKIEKISGYRIIKEIDENVLLDKMISFLDLVLEQKTAQEQLKKIGAAHYTSQFPLEKENTPEDIERDIKSKLLDCLEHERRNHTGAVIIVGNAGNMLLLEKILVGRDEAWFNEHFATENRPARASIHVFKLKKDRAVEEGGFEDRGFIHRGEESRLAEIRQQDPKQQSVLGTVNKPQV